MNAERTRWRALDEQAAGWLLRLQNERSPQTETAFRSWIESSAEHVQAFLEITALDKALDGLDAEGSVDVQQLLQEISTDDGARVVSLADSTVGVAARDASRSVKVWAFAIAAGLATLLAIGTLFVSLRPTTPTFLVTEVGEQRAVKLNDGSLVQMNTRSRIEVSFTEHARDVRLVDGEALFNVGRDATRPFRVIAGSTLIEAVGTQFNVYRHGDSTTVSVLEGRVRISAASGADAMLESGEVASVASNGTVTKPPRAEVSKEIAWRQRQLSFDHDSLAEAAQQFNRYNKIHIRIDDPEIAAREIEGVFNADEPQALVDFLALDESLRIERGTDLIVIRGRSQP